MRGDAKAGRPPAFVSPDAFGVSSLTYGRQPPDFHVREPTTRTTDCEFALRIADGAACRGGAPRTWPRRVIAGPLDFRLTTGLCKVNGAWTIVHEHHSVPTVEKWFLGPDA